MKRLFPVRLATLAVVLAAALAPEGIAETRWLGGLDHEALDATAYPLAPAAIVDGELYDVVADGSGRLYYAGDKEGALAAGEAVFLCKGEVFADGLIEVERSVFSLSGRSEPRGATREGLAEEITGVSLLVVDLRLRASRRFEDVTVGLLFYDDYGYSGLELRRIGRVESGGLQRCLFEVAGPVGLMSGVTRCALLFFGAGGEIVSDARGALTPMLNRFFEGWYQELVYAYQQRVGLVSNPVKLVHRYPVLFDAGARVGERDEPIVFKLLVDELGFVVQGDTEADVEPGLRQACELSLREWLFLPRLENGFPVRSRVRVPVYVQGR